MEQDRYQQNALVFIIGLISLLLSLSLFAFSFYIMPYLLWSWTYSVPGTILFIREWFKETFEFTDIGASWMVFLMFIIPAVVFGYISQFSSNYLDDAIYGLKKVKSEKQEEIKRDVQETLSFGLKLFLLIVLVISVVLTIEWLVAKPAI
ncbi:MAG: hypothetical protein WC785_01320 [Tatlockia sp.]|jgi:hypothetical protein